MDDCCACFVSSGISWAEAEIITLRILIRNWFSFSASSIKDDGLRGGEGSSKSVLTQVELFEYIKM